MCEICECQSGNVGKHMNSTDDSSEVHDGEDDSLVVLMLQTGLSGGAALMLSN
jgi:hypothetical protein